MDILNDTPKCIDDALEVIEFNARQDGRSCEEEINLIKSLLSEKQRKMTINELNTKTGNERDK